MRKRISTYISFLLLFVPSLLLAQQSSNLDSLLTAKTKDIPALNEKVNISVTNIPIQEFMRGVANTSGLNIDVDPNISATVINNFSDVRAKDILVFLARQYNLKVELIGNIITISQAKAPPIVYDFTVEYDSINDWLSMDVRDAALIDVAKEITSVSGKNVVLMPGLIEQKATSYIRNMPFEASISKFALSNGLEMEKSEDGFYMIKKQTITEIATAPDQRQQNYNQSQMSRQSRRSAASRGNEGMFDLDITVFPDDSIKISSKDAPVNVLIEELSAKANFNYFISPGLEALITGNVQKAALDDLLDFLFSGTDLAYRKQDNLYIIGEKKLIDYNEHRIIHLQNRSVEEIVENFPADLTESLEIKEFHELNSLFVTGPSYQIDELEVFVKAIDQVVPVVLIEVMIVYVNKSFNIATGMQAGLGDAPVETSGTLFPGIDMTIGADKINEIFNGSGWINLGNVSPNFYVTLKALETQGYVDLESTPKLSTLNGHEAEMTIGNTEYYLEEKTHLYGTQNPQQTTSEEYKAVNAELSLKIKPFVSGDDQITLKVEVSQSDFTERISKTAPPGSVNRDFNSQIRVKNNEMILLGGLMEKRKGDTGSGTPILSRIPIIKWFFSSRTKEDSDSKLSVLIRPTIVN